MLSLRPLVLPNARNNIKQDGHIDVNVRLRGGVEGQINVPGEFKGDVINADNIGKSTDELCDQWDVEFPSDLIER